MKKPVSKQAKSQEINNFIKKNRTGVIAALILIILNSVLLIINGSWIIERKIVEFYGDQQLYFDLAYNVLMGRNLKSPYTLGYPIFYMILIVIHDFPKDWTVIMGAVVSLQAFVMVPSIFFFIYRKQTRQALVILSLIFTFYFLNNIFFAIDPLLKYNFLGLVPLSEPLSILITVLCYVVYFKLNSAPVQEKSNLSIIAFLGFLIAFCVMIRYASVLLIAPIFLDLLLNKKFKLFVVTGIFSALFFTPQLVWNYWVSGNITFNGYIWWAEVINPVKTLMDIKGLYGIDSTAMFSIEYLKVNCLKLITTYTPLILLVLFSRLWKTKIEILITIFTIVNIIFYLSYWWSINGNLLERFLLPNYFLVIFFLSQKFRENRFKESF